MSDFEKAVDDANNLNSRPTDTELLEIYGLYKQATVGDCNTSQPGIFDLKGRSKWSDWNKLKGMSQEEAKEKYIAAVKILVNKYGRK